MNRYSLALLLFCISIATVWPQETEKKKNSVQLTGKLQTDIHFPQSDDSDQGKEYDSKVLSNTFADLNLNSDYVDAGLRFEMYKKPLPGFEAEYEGLGVPFFYVKGKYNKLQLTLGNFYEQFGSGLIFRTYEDRGLGIDNSLRGALLTYNTGIVNLKGLYCYQRNYWKYTKESVKGLDAEIYMSEWIDRLKENDIRMIFGSSFVSKYQQSELIMASLSERLNLPEHVGAFASRIRLQKNKVSVMTEFAVKANDPNSENSYIYKNGHAFLLSGSYSRKGLGLILQVKRSDNMGFKSQRTAQGRMLNINHFPAFCKQHSYALAALYPYATQANGEWAFNSDIVYSIKKGTFIGGKTGIDVNANFSRVNAIKKNFAYGGTSALPGTDGYTSGFFQVDKEVYYQDFNVSISKKISKTFALNTMYMNQMYNQQAIEGHANNGKIVYSNIFVVEGKYKLSKKYTLRSELQYLNTQQDEGNWTFGLLEFTMLPSFTFTVSDMYNNGSTNKHYYMIASAYAHNAHRFQLSWGRTRAGFNCSGGVCRYTPESKGLMVSYFMSF